MHSVYNNWSWKPKEAKTWSTSHIWISSAHSPLWRLYGHSAGTVALALEVDANEVIDAEVLPVLQFLWLQVLPVASLENFADVRCRSGCPVAIVNTGREFVEKCGSHPRI